IFKRQGTGTCWELDSFLMSCRVIGRTFEDVFLTACVSHLRETSQLPIRATFVPGPRNGLTRGFLDGLGFRLVDETAKGVRRFELDGEVNAPLAGIFSVGWAGRQ